MPDLSATDGASIHYEVWGRKDRTPVLMIQGLGTDSRGWALQRVPFGRRHQCVAPDNRGTGRSDKPAGPYDLEQMARDAVAALDAEEIERAHVMGASMGGVIAQIVAVRYPDRIRSLTLACTACRHHEWRRELLAEWADEVAAHGMQSMASDGLRWMVGPRLQRRFGMWINVLARLILSMPAEPFVSQVQAILNMTDEVRYELPTVAVPTLVITGSQDALTPVGDAEEIVELIPKARLAIVSGAAHGVMAEAPNAYNDTVLRFIDEVDAAQAPASAAV